MNNKETEIRLKDRLKNLVKRKSFILYNVILVTVILLNIASWTSTLFSDWYVDNVFVIISNVVSFITDIFPFSIGEFMIMAGIIFLVLIIVVTLLLPFLRKKWKTFYRFIYPFFAWVLVSISLVMTCNCFVLYHTSTIEETMFGGYKEEYSYEKLVIVYEHVVNELNELSEKMVRDEKGYILYEEDIMKVAENAMQSLGKRYKRLGGYYPDAKGILFSDFMSQNYMSGVYFPFSMEANYNTTMYIANNPAVICHEYAHLKGYIYEDEANFIGYIACIESDDLFFQYSGYLSVLYYIESDLFGNLELIGDDELVYRAMCVTAKDIVYRDNMFLTEESWKEVEDDSILDTEIVDEISDAFTDATLKINGVEDGMASYTRVVKLLLRYYEGILY